MILAIITSFALTAPSAGVTLTNGPSTIVSGASTNIGTAVVNKSNYQSNSITDATTLPSYVGTLDNNYYFLYSESTGLTKNGLVFSATGNSAKGNIQIVTLTPERLTAGISYGVASAIVTNQTYTFNWLSFTNPAINETNSLNWHLVNQLTKRTNNNGYVFYNRTNSTYQMPVLMAPTYWLKDVTNILASSISDTNNPSSWNWIYCMVSPRHCISANHIGPGPGQARIWLMPDGTYFTNTCIAIATNYGDCTVCLMEKVNPFFYKVMPDWTTKIEFGYTIPAPIVRGHYGSTSGNITTFISMGSIQSGGWDFTPYIDSYYNQIYLKFGDYSAGDIWVGGDSSSPSWTIINNEAVLIGAAFTPQRPFALGFNTNAINAAMAWVSTNNGAPVYQLTVYDLSVFPDL